LEELVTAFIDKIEAQAKTVSDKIIENKLQEVDKLCMVRKQIVSHVANMVDDIARAERAINLSDAIELVLMDREIIKNPPPLTIHLPQYTVPWVGPEGSFDNLFGVDFLPAQDPCWLDPIFQDVIVQDVPLITDNSAADEAHGFTSMGTHVKNDHQWAWSVTDKGMYISISADNRVCTTTCPDVYENSFIFGDIVMQRSTWYWKIKFLELTNNKQVCYGVTTKPFDANDPKPYKRIWGWSSNGCALPSYETRCHEAKLRAGSEVWIKFDADLGIIEAYWPHSGMSGNINIGTRAAGKNVAPVAVLGRRGNAIQLIPEAWSIPDN
jgi:hypothetical protein